MAAASGGRGRLDRNGAVRSQGKEVWPDSVISLMKRKIESYDSRRSIKTLCVAALAGLLSMGVAGPLYAGDNLIDALKGGKVDLYLRYRGVNYIECQPRAVQGSASSLPPDLIEVGLAAW